MTAHAEDRAKWKQGYKTGIRTREEQILNILQRNSMIWWDDSKRAWLDVSTGKPVYGLDWREENETEG